MKSITFNIPEMSDLEISELKMMVASRLYEQGRLSLGQAAEVAEYSKRTFTELLGKYNVSVFNFPTSDLLNDIANA